MKKTFILLILSTIGTLFINCTGDKGAIGPKGAVGQQGLKGEKGETGASGEFPKTQTGTFTRLCSI